LFKEHLVGVTGYREDVEQLWRSQQSIDKRVTRATQQVISSCLLY